MKTRLILLVILMLGLIAFPGAASAGDVSGHSFLFPNGCRADFVSNGAFGGGGNGESGTLAIHCGNSMADWPFSYSGELLAICAPDAIYTFVLIGGDLYYIDLDFFVMTADD